MTGAELLVLLPGTRVHYYHDVGECVPARVDSVHHYLDDQGTYTEVDVTLYSGQSLVLVGVSARARLRLYECGGKDEVEIPPNPRMRQVRWEDVGPEVQRLCVEGGWLYRAGSQVVFVPGNNT